MRVNKFYHDYMQARKNAQSRLYRLQKQGYYGYKIPAIPKRITEGSIRRLENLTRSSMIPKMQFYDYETQQSYPGIQGEKIRKSYKVQRPKDATVSNTAGSDILDSHIIDMFLNEIGMYLTNKAFAPGIYRVQSFIDNMISEYGKHQVALALEAERKAGNVQLPRILYKDQVDSFLSGFKMHILDNDLTSADILDAVGFEYVTDDEYEEF